MDLSLYLRVLWRFRLILAIGFVLAAALAFASLAKVNFAHGSPTLSYRQQPTWQATTRLFVTQEGFPWGRSVFPAPSTTPLPPTGGSDSALQFADPARFAGLAVLYAQLINGDLIQRQVLTTLPPGDALSASAVTDASTNSALPLVAVMGTSHSPAQAARVSQTGADLFRSYISRQQAAAGIPANQRVLLQVVSTRAALVAGRKKTLAILAFMAVMIAAIGLTLVLENIRPQIQAVAPATPARRVGTRNTA